MNRLPFCLVAFVCLVVTACTAETNGALSGKPINPACALIEQADTLAVRNRDGEALDLYIQALGDHPDAEYVLRSLDTLNRSTNDNMRLCEALGRVRFGNQGVAALAVQQRAFLLWNMGRVDESIALIMQLAPLTNWLICGGFENDERTGLQTVFGPESDADAARDYDGKQWRVAWRPSVPLTRSAEVDLQLIRPDRWITAYLRTALVAPTATVAVLHIDFSGAFRVWLDGRPAAQETEYVERSADMYAVPLSLRAGTNDLLVKLCAQYNGAQCFLRLSDSAGAPLALATTRPVDGATPACQQTDQWPSAEPSPRIASLRDYWEGTSTDVDAGLTLARYYCAAKRFEQAIKVFERVKAARPLSASDLFAMALAYERKESESEAVALYRQALLVDTNANAARVGIAQHYMRRGMHELAHPVLLDAMAANSNDVTSRRVLVDLLGARGWDEDAFQLAEETARLFGRYESAVLDFAHTADGNGHVAIAEEFARKALAANPSSGGARDILIRMCESERRYMELEVETAKLEQLAPSSPLPFLIRARTAMQLRDADRGLAVCERALLSFPDLAEFHNMKGDFLYMQRDKQHAIDAYQRSLVYAPDDLRLRRYLDYLKGKSDVFFVKYSLDDNAVRKRMDATRLAADIDKEAITETVLDQDLVQLYEDGSSRQQRHVVIRVLNARGVQEASSMNVPTREVLRAVTHKKDGRVIEASHIKSGQIEFADVQIGDAVECKFRDDRYGGSWLDENFSTVQGFERQQSPVRYAEFVLSVPTNRTITYLASSAAIQYEKTPMLGGIVYRWRLKNVPMFKSEPLSPPYLDIGTFVAVSTFTNWNPIAQWQQAMLSDVSRGDHNVRQLAEKITAGSTCDVDRIDRVFRYVTDNIRYTQMYESRVAGVKPHPIPNILANQCGDCKDLALLTSELVKSLGISAQLALIRTRNMGELVTNVPSPDVFNHVIVFLPSIGPNGLFVDPTFRYGTYDMLPEMCQDVHALVMTGNTFRIVDTPVAPPEDNRSDFVLDGELQADGALTGTLNLVMHRLEAASFRGALENIDSRDKIAQYILAQIDPSARLGKLVIENESRTNAPLILRIQFAAPSFAGSDNGRITAKIPWPFKTDELLGGLEKRAYPFRLPSLRNERRSYSFRLPGNASWTIASTNVALATKFGSFSFQASASNRNVRVAWSLSLTQQLVPTNQYADFRDFVAKVSDTTMQTMQVIVKGTK